MDAGSAFGAGVLSVWASWVLETVEIIRPVLSLRTTTLRQCTSPAAGRRGRCANVSVQRVGLLSECPPIFQQAFYIIQDGRARGAPARARESLPRPHRGRLMRLNHRGMRPVRTASLAAASSGSVPRAAVLVRRRPLASRPIRRRARTACTRHWLPIDQGGSSACACLFIGGSSIAGAVAPRRPQGGRRR